MAMQSMDEVARPLNKAIVSIINICESLRETHVSPTDTCSNYSQIREYTEHAQQGLIKSEKMIKGKLEDLDECMENLTIKKYKTEQEKREKSQAMKNLQTKKESAENSLMYSKRALAKAEENVESANYDMRAHQDRMDSSREIADTGTILLAIPIFGWIAGPIMMVEGEKAYEQALESLRAAESEKQQYLSQMRNHSIRVSHYGGIISRTQNEIWQTKEALKQIEIEIKGVRKQLEHTADIQENVRRAVYLLSVLSGRVAVLERQTRRVALWKPIINIMEDVMKAIVHIAENRLLYRDGVPSFVNALRENVGDLLVLCSSSSDSENDSYY